jgi:hypothetical protein
VVSGQHAGRVVVSRVSSHHARELRGAVAQFDWTIVTTVAVFGLPVDPQVREGGVLPGVRNRYANRSIVGTTVRAVCAARWHSRHSVTAS